MNKPDDIVMVFGNPVKCETPVGQCRLIKKRRDIRTILEEWNVEFLDNEGHFYDALIKKNCDGKE